MNKRVYICHTFYHVYIACLKELNLSADERGNAGGLWPGTAADQNPEFFRDPGRCPLRLRCLRGQGCGLHQGIHHHPDDR